MVRVSVTTLEKFRRYMVEASPYDTEEALIESIKGIFLGNDKTKTGGAFHKLIEGDFSSEEHGFMADGIHFTTKQAKAAFNFKAEHRSMIHEVNVGKVYTLRNGLQVYVSGRVDGMEGVVIRDAKCKFGNPDFYEYMDSCQWKFYLDMMNLNVFYYDIFEVQGFNELPLKPEVVFCENQPLRLSRYGNLQKDCTEVINDFFDYIQNRNMWHFLKLAPAKVA